MSRPKGLKSTIHMPSASTSDSDWLTMRQIHEKMDRTIPNISGYFQSGMRKLAFMTFTKYTGRYPTEEQLVETMVSVSFHQLVEDALREKSRER